MRELFFAALLVGCATATAKEAAATNPDKKEVVEVPKLTEGNSVRLDGGGGKSNKEIEAAYKQALKTNNCAKEYWSRYEFAEYFTSFAKIGKVTPYDVLNGSPYERRNLTQYSYDEFFNNYAKYVGSHMPEAFRDKFEQEFPSEEEKTKNQKSVFNTSIMRDYECYKKLK